MMNAPPGSRCALYVRVSTGHQRSENQLPSLRRFVKLRQWKIEHIYDETKSAVKTRPIFDQMMKDAHARKFDVLAVWALDRLGRSLIGNLDAVFKLDAAGIHLASIEEPWLETHGPQRELLISIFSWVAKQERERLSERTRAGLARAKAEGRALGRPRAVIPMAAVRTMLGDEWTPAAIARKLRVSVDSLRRAMVREGLP